MEDDKDLRIVAKSDIPIGHKLALKDYKPGETVIKYGVDIGKSSRRSPRASTRTCRTSKPSGGDHGLSKASHGYLRENGRVGVRNHVIVPPVDDLSNAAAQAVENNIKGVMAIPHPYGRLQFGADLELHFRTLIGAGSNPNVAAVVVIGIEDQWTQRVVEGIKKTGKPVAGFGIELHGDHDTIHRASKGRA